jgi:CubicO group peptidase (beta-lactamase class C family)
MKKLFLIFVSLILYQVSLFAQLEFWSDNYQIQKSSQRPTESLNVNIDSLMLDSIITEYMNTELIPGNAALIIKENNVIWNKNYGYRNMELQLPVEDSTLFLIASISKTVMATAVMQLWENGLIDLDGNINNYLPNGFRVKNPYFPHDTIRVKMLMTHSSSLQDNWNILWSLYACGDYPVSYDSFLVNYFTPGGTYYTLQNFYNYHPGQISNYSNTASCLLALMIEHLSGKPFDEYIRDSIFVPLSMNSSSWFLEGMDTSKIAVPYINHPPVLSCHSGFAYWPIGQLRTNKLELSNLLSAYLNGGVFNNNRILDTATISLMLSDKLGFPNWMGEVQGLIWIRLNTIIQQSTTWGHDGLWLGCQTAVSICLEKKWAVISFINKATPSNLREGFYPCYIQLAKYADLYGNIYAIKPLFERRYARINIDSVLFRTRISNVYNHQFTSHLIYANTNSTQKDSLTLYDDGKHGDLLVGDGFYGGYIPPRTIEDYYTLSVSTIDNQTNKYFSTADMARFTTAGPIRLDSIRSLKGITNYYNLRPFIRNEGTMLTITNAKIQLKCSDPWVSGVAGAISLPSIAPGASVGASSWTAVTYIDSIFPGYFNLKAEIMVDGRTYWKDSMKVKVITGVEEDVVMPSTFKLGQNFPNPFNPSTKISWQLPIRSQVTLKVYDVLGNVVVTLVDEEKEPGYHSIEFNGSNLSSGVYFYQLRAGNFVDTKEMVLVK